MPWLWCYFRGNFLHPTDTTITTITTITTTIIFKTQQGNRLVLTTLLIIQCWLANVWAS